MQRLQTVLQDCAALAPSAAGPCSIYTWCCRPCRTSTQHCRATQDSLSVLQHHAASAARLCRSRTWCCRDGQHLQPELQGHAGLACNAGGPANRGHMMSAPGAVSHAGPADRTAGPCRTHSRCRGAGQNLHPSLQDPHHHCRTCTHHCRIRTVTAGPLNTYTRCRGHAGPANRVAEPCQAHTWRCHSCSVPDSPQCHGAAQDPAPGRTGAHGHGPAPRSASPA
uniref:Uncharacterized protein n=1 Tax=Columba livia TaxID=8932 RepID=R7VUR0_COLLI